MMYIIHQTHARLTLRQIKNRGFILHTCYKPHEWRKKLLQMALQIEIRSTTERQGRNRNKVKTQTLKRRGSRGSRGFFGVLPRTQQ